MIANSQRCTPGGVALSFVWALAPGGGLLAAGWTDADAGNDEALAGERGRLHAAQPAPAGTGSPIPVPFEPAEFFRDPRCWRPPRDVPAGSAHARRVWRALCAIPVGETRSYGQIAREIGSAARAVGQACRANPWPLFIPCHRVVPAGGRDTVPAGGYAGSLHGPLADVKAWLLAHETAMRSS
ncbi:MAG: MGMT family protein [Thioalkalivibrio sp.]|nr:MAG: MGMT family protein [Thioalkalivibrio sp.]